MSTPKPALPATTWPQVIVIAQVKPVWGQSRANQKRTTSAISKKLRQEGIYLMHLDQLWFAVADHPCTTRDVEKQLLKWTLRSRQVRLLTLYGGYSFRDFFALRRKTGTGKPDANSLITKWVTQLAFNVLREGDASWPIYEDLMHSLPAMHEIPVGMSRLLVTFGD